MKWIVVVLVLAPAFAGCAGPSASPSEEDSVDAISIFDALTMDDGRVTERTASSLTFSWESTIGPGMFDLRDETDGSTVWRTTAFDVPSRRVVVTADLSWSVRDADLVLFVDDHLGRVACSDVGPTPPVTSLSVPVAAPETGVRGCAGPIVVEGPGRGGIRIGADLNMETDVPFSITFTLSLPPLATSLAKADPCVHPWPCADGSEWPLGLTGPFDLLEEVRLEIPSHDGVLLSARLWRPDLPDGVGAPTIVFSDPYIGNPSSASSRVYPLVARRDFVPNGYALLAVSVRGTAASGGCFDHHARASQLDPASLIDWVASQPWSNGRVGMSGISYMGVTSVHGAIYGSEALKTALVVGVPQAYLYHHTPQGAFSTSASLYELDQHNVETPPVSGDPDVLAPSITKVTERSCEEYRRNLLVEPTGQWTDDRDPAFWEARDMYRGFANVTAALFMVQGFEDAYVPWGQEVAWDLLAGPKRMMYGQWGHRIPPLTTWRIDQLTWFDYWLKGVGEPPGVGTVAFQDDARAWHAETGWPPREAHDEVLYLNGGALAATRAPGDRVYASAPQRVAGSPAHFLCASVDADAALVYTGEAASADTSIAGNPFASLMVTSDAPGGLFGAYLFNIPAGGACSDARWLTWGAADLRFHAGNMIGTDFPVGRATPVRIDFEPLATRIAAGDRLVLVLTNPGPYDDRDANDASRVVPHGPGSNGRSGQAYYPTLTLHGGAGPEASHLVLPVVHGSLGGGAPTLAYAPRPFMPQGEVDS